MAAPIPFTWVFARGLERLRVRRPSDRELQILTSDRIERFDFETTHELVDFQVRLEAQLRDQGWAFVEYSPERRTGPEDRRHVRRPTSDRRKRR